MFFIKFNEVLFQAIIELLFRMFTIVSLIGYDKFEMIVENIDY